MNLELFSCSGGMAEGFRRAGITFDLAVDVSPDACDSYERNLGHRPIQIDVRDLIRMFGHIAPSKCPQLVVADPPCTPWSRAGKREGLADQRDMLRETAAVIRTLQPQCWLIGNVPGLDDAPNHHVVQDVIGGLRGYCVDYAKLDAADYGVPQHRIRPFWFGHPAGTRCIRWPLPTHGDPRTIGHAALGDDRKPWVTCRQALGHLLLEQLGKPVRVSWASESYAPSRPDEPGKVVPCSMPGNRGAVLAAGRSDHRLSDPDQPARTLTANTHGDGALLANVKHPINRPDEPSFTVTAKGDNRGAQGACVLAWPWDRPSTVVCGGPVIAPPGRSGKRGESQRGHPNAVKLSELAGAILQGFPEHWHFAGGTKKARWSQIGMAMPPGLAHAVARQIVAWMQRSGEVAA